MGRVGTEQMPWTSYSSSYDENSITPTNEISLLHSRTISQMNVKPKLVPMKGSKDYGKSSSKLAPPRSRKSSATKKEAKKEAKKPKLSKKVSWAKPDHRSSKDAHKESTPARSRKSSRDAPRKSSKPRRSSHERPRSRRSSHDKHRRGSDDRHHSRDERAYSRDERAHSRDERPYMQRERRDTFVDIPPQPMMMQRTITPVSWRPTTTKSKPCCSAGPCIFVAVMILLVLGGIGGYFLWKDHQNKKNSQPLQNEVKTHKIRSHQDGSPHRDDEVVHASKRSTELIQEVHETFENSFSGKPEIQEPKHKLGDYVTVKSKQSPHKGKKGQVIRCMENSHAHKKHYTYDVQLYMYGRRESLLYDQKEEDLDKTNNP